MSGPTFEINRIKIITTHSYNLDKNQDCTICRQHLNSSSIYALEKGIKSQVQQGTCGHMFHNECIDPWLKTNKKCPICCIPWNILDIY
jgi:E3 ubiquitin-protein ligase RBX1